MEKYPSWKGLFEIIQNNLPLTLIIVAALNLLISSLYSFFIKPSIKTLLDELEKIKEENALIAENVKKVFDGYLYQLSKKLEFGSKASNCERVSIYIHDKSSLTLFLLGDFLLTPNLEVLDGLNTLITRVVYLRDGKMSGIMKMIWAMLILTSKIVRQGMP